MTPEDTNDIIQVTIQKEKTANDDSPSLSYHSTLRGEYQEVGVGSRTQMRIVERLTTDDGYPVADYSQGDPIATMRLTRAGEIDSVEWHEPTADDRQLALIRRLESKRFDDPIVSWKWSDGSTTMTDTENRAMCKLLDKAAERHDLDQFEIGETIGKAWLIDGEVDEVEWQ